MHLTDNQIHELIDLLKPAFETEQQRQTVLEAAFNEEPQLVADLPLEAADAAEFASTLLDHLKDAHTQSGDPAVAHLLESLSNGSDVPGTREKLSAYIRVLRAPEPPASTSQRAAVVAHYSGHRQRRRRSLFSRTIRRVFKLIPFQAIVVILLLGLVIPAAGVVVFATDAYARVQESLGSLERVIRAVSRKPFTALTLEDLERLQASVRNFAHTLSSAQQQTGLLSRFASVDPNLEATFGMLTAAQQITGAAQNILSGAQPALTFLLRGQEGGSVTAQVSSNDRLVEFLRAGQNRFSAAADQLMAAQATLEAIDFSRISPQLVLQARDLMRYQEQLHRIARVLLAAPEAITSAFGVDAPQDYLILSQNNDELRPSGGYISTFGWMRVRNFRIADYGYSATTALSPNPPPAEMAKELDIPAWWIHFPRPIYTAFDGSWYADFPSTARMAAWFYDNGRNPRSPVDGVIAIDITGFEMLLNGLGEITLPDTGETITADNFREVVYRVRAESSDHKEFVADLYRQILAEWQTASPERSTLVLNAAVRALQEKHIMVYFADPRLNDLIDLLGWSGAQTPGDYDYLMVADANLGNKSNHSIIREIAYDVTIQADGSLKCRAYVNYQYPAALADADPAVAPQHYGSQKDYYNLMQIFVPQGSQLTGAGNLQANLVTDLREAVTLFVTGTRIRFDSSERFEFAYTTPPLIETLGPYRRYRLLVQKQPGTRADVVSVQVTLPPDSQLVSASPSPTASYMLDSQVLEFRLTLSTDQWIDLLFD